MTLQPSTPVQSALACDSTLLLLFLSLFFAFAPYLSSPLRDSYLHSKNTAAIAASSCDGPVRRSRGCSCVSKAAQAVEPGGDRGPWTSAFVTGTC